MKTPLLSAAFPSNLSPTVSRLALLIAPPSCSASDQTFLASCNGEPLHIPYRIYVPPISDIDFASLNVTEQSITACWFTRHHDGYVRERFLRALPAFDKPWIIAYVIALCGEYVVELLNYIWEHRNRFHPEMLGSFLRENPILLCKTRQRIRSYWNCYYRHASPHFNNYVGNQLLTFFDNSLTN
jgi:hypothetical protein